MQISLLLLTLVAALVGTLGKTRDDKQRTIWRRVKFSGWIIAGVSVISFCLTLLETRKTARETEQVNRQNSELRANVSTLVRQLDETHDELARERSATLLTLFAGWEIVKDVTLRIESQKIANDDDFSRAEVDPFWFTHNLVSYEISLRTNDLAAYLRFNEKVPGFDPVKDIDAARDYEPAPGHDIDSLSGTDDVEHNFILTGPDRLQKLLYEMRTGWKPLKVKFTYPTAPSKASLEQLRAALADRTHFGVRALAPIEEKRFLAERRQHIDDPNSDPNLPHVYWRVNIPLMLEGFETKTADAEDPAPNEVVVSFRSEAPFIEPDFEQEPGPQPITRISHERIHGG